MTNSFIVNFVSPFSLVDLYISDTSSNFKRRQVNISFTEFKVNWSWFQCWCSCERLYLDNAIFVCMKL
jgi:hypothetical protein